MKDYKNFPIHAFESQEEWAEWLSSNHDSATGIWLKFAKKGSGRTTVTYVQAREEALIIGWIDGLTNAYDSEYFLIRFSPRKPKSVWSKINKEIVEGLIAAGKMRPEGLAKYKAAEADGRLAAAYDGQSSMVVPDDFAAALSKRPAAREAFEALNKVNRYAFLYRIQSAAKAETRSSRIEKFIGMLENGEVFHSHTRKTD